MPDGELRQDQAAHIGDRSRGRTQYGSWLVTVLRAGSLRGSAVRARTLLAAARAQAGQQFGNTRTVRNLFEQVLRRQADRLASDPDMTQDELTMITHDDLPGVGAYRRLSLPLACIDESDKNHAATAMPRRIGDSSRQQSAVCLAPSGRGLRRQPGATGIHCLRAESA